MLGAIAGDIVGSVHEFKPWPGHWNDFPLFTPQSKFTDDTVMTLAVGEALKNAPTPEKLPELLTQTMHAYGEAYPRAGYGGKFAKWLQNKETEPYNSFGNGSAMRVSAAGWAATSLEEAENFATITAKVTHNHPEGIKGACAVAGCIFLARKGEDKSRIKDYAETRFNYNLSRPLDSIRENYCFDETCQGSVPEAITAFLESANYEEAIRKAIWLKGDADTQAAIAGSIAEAYYGGVPDHIGVAALERLTPHLKQSFESTQEWLDQKPRVLTSQ